MSLKFTGRELQLAEIKQLIQAKQGAVFAVSGNAGIGKSTLLKEVAQRYPKKAKVFIDLANNVASTQKAVQFLIRFAKHAKGLEQTKEALDALKDSHKTNPELQNLLKETITLGFEANAEELDLSDDEKSKFTTIAKTLLQLGEMWSKSRQEKQKEKLGNPELSLLKALKQDCKNQPLIFLDTYECLQAAQDLAQQKITTDYSLLHESLSANSESLNFRVWLDRFVDFLTAQGAIVFIAGRQTGRWQAENLPTFGDEEILDMVSGSGYRNLQALLTDEQTEQALLSLLKRLSQNAIPLWLRLALNFVNLELNKTPDILKLAALPDVETLFAMPEIGSDWEDVSDIENATCKLALVNRVFLHNPEWKAQAWKMALPRRLNKAVLEILFARDAQAICEAFVKTGLMSSSLRWIEGDSVSLHQEIRDLLLAYAKHEGFLETEETAALHLQLADLFAQRYQKNADIQLLLEQLYHQLMADGNADLAYIKEPDVLHAMALVFQTEKQYQKMTQVFLRIIEIQPDYENAWFGLGAALEHLGKLDEAIAAYQKQIEIKPNDENAWNSLGLELERLGKNDNAQKAFSHSLEINPQNISTLSNDAELALIQNDKVRCFQRIASALVLVDNKDDLYMILPFLAWLAEPENSVQPVLTAIAQLDSRVKITWDFTDTEPAILRLPPAQQTIARQFIAYFQSTGELPPQTN